MSVIEAFEDAADILRALALIPVLIITSVGATNIGNPEFDFFSWFEMSLYALVSARLPNITHTPFIVFLILTFKLISNYSE